MKGKKIVPFTLCLLLLSSSLIACSKGTASKEPQTGADAKPIKLTFWSGVPAEAGPQLAVDNWNKQNPNIQVEYVRYVNDDSGNIKLDTALLTGQGVDIYATHNFPRFETRVKAQVALDLGQFKDYNIDEMMGPEASDWKVDNKYYAMPTKRDLHFIWLNKDALDKAGLAVPYNWTWDDMRMYAKKLSEQKQWGMLQDMVTWDFVLDSPMAVEGVVKPDGSSNMDNRLTKKILENMHAMMYDDKSIPLYAEQLSKKMPVETEFLKGNAGMYYAGEWIFRFANNLKDYPRDFKIAIAPIPKVTKDQENYRVFGGLGDAIAINPQSKNIDAAWKFLKWYADGGMLPLTQGGRIPSSKAVNSDEAFKVLLQGVEDKYDVESMKKVLFSKDFKTFQSKLAQQMIDARKEQYQLYFTNNQSLDQMFVNLVKRHNDFLKQTKK
ncbi:ABC transporter substrate-binding protein [Paenibacillus radicis (ex Xue et al. 2023)]|uniref:Extracellular solute-binding protein n=1 Tax=Paenibacillus radicis (ex Xue et al. 2023) TaxID=2972489 RepID=A0ABT1YTI7_9BACL|nr:extracellular solute-binding protein [Paenibacillus radicis (ex Xue et al. 2023)]MCR8636506.1 extracellular solute-binding protein [Paenibacillus radicis (ex Xue et al. 2023)]